MALKLIPYFACCRQCQPTLSRRINPTTTLPLTCRSISQRRTIAGSTPAASGRPSRRRKRILSKPRPPEPGPLPTMSRKDVFPLGMVLDACPDFGDYAKGGIANWRDFMATASLVRSVLGISPSAWDDAQKVMGEIPAAILMACILQRVSTIKSAGGYLRSLTRKAEAGEFSLGPVLMALINTRRRQP